MRPQKPVTGAALLAVSLALAAFSQVRPQPPSPNFTMFQGPAFSLSHPENWLPSAWPSEQTWTFAPPADVHKGKTAAIDIAIGMYAGLHPAKARTLAAATDELLRQTFLTANPQARIIRRETGTVTVAGQPAESILFENSSPLPGETELVWTVTSLRPNGLFWASFCSPKQEAGSMGQVYWRILQSVRFDARPAAATPAAQPTYVAPADRTLETHSAQWVRSANPAAGFTVSHPPQWQVDVRPNALILVRSPDGRAFVLVHPFLLQSASTAQQFIRQAPAYLDSVFPNAQVGRYQQRSARPDEAIASLTYASGAATLLCSIDGRSGMLYAIAAPQAEFAARRRELTAILKTFSFTGAQGGGAAGPDPAGLQYVQWVEPREQAFYFEIPRGWRATGGMYRQASIDTRAGVNIQSPDGQVNIIAGDENIPSFMFPSQTLAMAGVREGSWYQSPYGVRLMVRSYVPAVRFAAEYVQQRFSRACQGLRIIDNRDRSDMAQGVQRTLQQIPGGILQQQITMGDASFTCDSGGRPLYGYIFASTIMRVASGTGGWSVPNLGGFISTAEGVPAAMAALGRLAATIQFNVQWLQRQRHLSAEAGRIVSDTHAFVSKTINDNYWNKHRVWDDIARRRSNNILGLTDVRDPQTGETWKVSSGHNYYWRRDHTDVIGATNVYERPDINFSPLEEW